MTLKKYIERSIISLGWTYFNIQSYQYDKLLSAYAITQQYLA